MILSQVLTQISRGSRGVSAGVPTRSTSSFGSYARTLESGPTAGQGRGRQGSTKQGLAGKGRKECSEGGRQAGDEDGARSGETSEGRQASRKGRGKIVGETGYAPSQARRRQASEGKTLSRA